MRVMRALLLCITELTGVRNINTVVCTFLSTRTHLPGSTQVLDLYYHNHGPVLYSIHDDYEEDVHDVVPAAGSLHHE